MEMKLYKGTKQVYATPMTRGEYNTYRGWSLPQEEDPADLGYLIEYVDGGKPCDDRHTGYISWSPKDVFDRAYHTIEEASVDTIDFSEMVTALVKDGQEIIDELQPCQADLLHMAVGVSGEAGELLDAIKKHAIYHKPLDLENVIEELGDLEFFMERIRQIAGITRQQTIEANIAKLGKRYNKGAYSNEQAQERLDKVAE